MSANNGPKTLGTDDFVYPTHVEERQIAASDEVIGLARGSISNPIARDVLPEYDFDETGDTTWSEGDVAWNQTPDESDLGNESGEAEYDVYSIDSDTGNADDRTFAFYGFRAIENGDAIIQVKFKASDGQTFERSHVQGMVDTADTDEGKDVVTLTEPIKFGPQDNGTISFVYDMDALDTDDLVKVEVLGKTGEKMGRRVGSRS